MRRLPHAAHSSSEHLASWPQAIEEPAPAAGSDSAGAIRRVVEEWRGHTSAPSKLMPYLDVVQA